MSFANPWGLLALAALPAIAAIHLFHRRYPRLEVSGLHLWGVAQMTHTPGRRRERLPLTSSLLLELLAALVLALALARPQVDATDGAVHLVVVLDGSASMSARRLTAAGTEKTFRSLAIEALDERVAALPAGSVVTLIESGRRPVLIFGPQGHPSAAIGALEGWLPESVAHDLLPSWSLADQLAAESGELLFVTDNLPDENMLTVPGRMEILSVGEPQPNLAITAARWVIGGDDSTGADPAGKVHLRIVNLGPARAEATLTAESPDGETTREVFSRTLTLAPREVMPFEATIPASIGQLDVRVVSDRDALGLDSRVRLVEPTPRRVKIAVTLETESVARQQVMRALVALPGWTPSASDDADLVIGPASVDLVAPDGGRGRDERWFLGIGPVDESPAARESSVDLSDRSVFVLERRHALLEGVVLGGVIWGGVQPLDFGFTPLISSGQRALLVQRTGQPGNHYVMNIDLARSNFTDTPDWPILLSNLLESCRDAMPGPRRTNYRVAENVRFRLDQQASDGEGMLSLVGGHRPRHVARAPNVDIAGLVHPGIYTLKDGDRQLARFAVNFQDIDESALGGLVAGERAASVSGDSSGFEVDSPYTWLILLAIVVVIGLALGDWQVLRGGRIEAWSLRDSRARRGGARA